MASGDEGDVGDKGDVGDTGEVGEVGDVGDVGHVGTGSASTLEKCLMLVRMASSMRGDPVPEVQDVSISVRSSIIEDPVGELGTCSDSSSFGGLGSW